MGIRLRKVTYPRGYILTYSTPAFLRRRRPRTMMVAEALERDRQVMGSEVAPVRVTIPEAVWGEIQHAAWDLGATLAGEDWPIDVERANAEWESLAEAIRFADVLMEPHE